MNASGGDLYQRGKGVKFMKIQLKVKNLCPLSHIPKSSRGLDGVFAGPILVPGPYVSHP